MNKQNIVLDFPSETWVIDNKIPYRYNKTLDHLKELCEFIHKQELTVMYKRHGLEHLMPNNKIVKKTHEYTCFQVGDILDPIFDVEEHRIDVIFDLSLN